MIHLCYVYSHHLVCSKYPKEKQELLKTKCGVYDTEFCLPKIRSLSSIFISQGGGSSLAFQWWLMLDVVCFHNWFDFLGPSLCENATSVAFLKDSSFWWAPNS